MRIWVAASHFTEDKKKIEELVKLGAGGVVLKSALNLGSLCKRDCRMCQSLSGYLKKKRLFIDSDAAGFTFYTFHEDEICEYLFSDEVIEILGWLKKKYSHVFRVASIISKTQKDVLEMARLFEKNGAQAIEFNGLKYLEHGRISKKTEKVDFLCSILKKLKSTVSIPVYIKLWPDVLSSKNFQRLSRWAEGATITNSFLTKNLSVRLRRAIKQFRQKKEKEVAVHGEPLWQYVREYLPKARKYFSHVSACGGIYTIERVKKAFTLGADSVQLCSAIELHGLQFMRESLEGFMPYFSKTGKRLSKGRPRTLV